MDAAQDDLILADEVEFAGFEFLHLGDEFTSRVHFFHGLDDLCAGRFVHFVAEAGTLAAVVLCQNLMSAGYDGFNFRRRADDSVFALFDVF